MFNWRGTTQVGEQRRVQIYAAVLGEREDARWDQEAEGYGDYKGYGRGRVPVCEGVDGVSWEVERGCEVMYWDCWVRWVLATPHSTNEYMECEL
jgi:hypothetical protein